MPLIILDILRKKQKNMIVQNHLEKRLENYKNEEKYICVIKKLMVNKGLKVEL